MGSIVKCDSFDFDILAGGGRGFQINMEGGVSSRLQFFKEVDNFKERIVSPRMDDGGQWQYIS